MGANLDFSSGAYVRKWPSGPKLSAGGTGGVSRGVAGCGWIETCRRRKRQEMAPEGAGGWLEEALQCGFNRPSTTLDGAPPAGLTFGCAGACSGPTLAPDKGDSWPSNGVILVAGAALMWRSGACADPKLLGELIQSASKMGGYLVASAGVEFVTGSGWLLPLGLFPKAEAAGTHAWPLG